MRFPIAARIGMAMAVAALASPAMAQAPRANGETLNIQHYAGTTGNMHAHIAAAKGFCQKYNFKCELKIINSGILGIQTLVGKTIDIAQAGAEQTAATVLAGANIAIVGTSLTNNVLALSARADVPLPNKDKGYPAVMADFKGLKIGVPARGAASEIFMNVMLAEAGLKPTDVTYVAVGGPQTAYTSMVVGKQVDAVVMFDPLMAICRFSKTCNVVVDMPNGEGPRVSREMAGAGVILAARRDFADANPQLMAAFVAAMTDAMTWARDPANFEEVLALYKTHINFGDLPGADELRRAWVKSAIGLYSPDLKVSRKGLKAALDFGVEAKTLEKPVEVGKVLWDKAPTME